MIIGVRLESTERLIRPINPVQCLECYPLMRTLVTLPAQDCSCLSRYQCLLAMDPFLHLWASSAHLPLWAVPTHPPLWAPPPRVSRYVRCAYVFVWAIHSFILLHTFSLQDFRLVLIVGAAVTSFFVALLLLLICIFCCVLKSKSKSSIMKVHFRIFKLANSSAILCIVFCQ